MTRNDDRKLLERVLEETCRRLPHGGDHEARSYVALRLTNAATGERMTLGQLGTIARKALADFQGGHHDATGRTTATNVAAPMVPGRR